MTSEEKEKMAINEAGIADLALDFSKLMAGCGPQLRALLDEMPIEKGRSAEFYEGGLETVVAISQFLEKELERGNMDGKFAMMIVGAFSARCAELLIDAKLRGD
jgi:hypothetical protein